MAAEPRLIVAKTVSPASALSFEKLMVRGGSFGFPDATVPVLKCVFVLFKAIAGKSEESTRPFGEEESFYALVSSFGIYIKRNKLISDDLAEIYENLVRFAKKAFMLKTKLPYQRQKDYYKKVEALDQKIKETKKIINISWLLEEVGRLND